MRNAEHLKLLYQWTWRQTVSFCLVQPRRLSFGGFGTLRKKRQDDGEEYVCPMNVEMPKSSSFQRGRVLIYEENLEHLEQVRRRFCCCSASFRRHRSGRLVWFWFVCFLFVWLFISWQMEDSEGTVRQIGAFSDGINNLTVRHRAAPVQSDR